MKHSESKAYIEYWSGLTKYQKVEAVQKHFPKLSKEYGSLIAIYWLSSNQLNKIYCLENNLPVVEIETNSVIEKILNQGYYGW